MRLMQSWRFQRYRGRTRDLKPVLMANTAAAHFSQAWPYHHCHSKSQLIALGIEHRQDTAAGFASPLCDLSIVLYLFASKLNSTHASCFTSPSLWSVSHWRKVDHMMQRRLGKKNVCFCLGKLWLMIGKIAKIQERYLKYTMATRWKTSTIQTHMKRIYTS